MASSSSSHQRNQEFNAFAGIEPAGERRKVSESSTLFDVFINHRGPDVKHTLATEFYNSLEQSGIRAFLDSQEKELGNSFPSTIETAIRSAKVHIAIFSKGYAESPWCLIELVLMLESTAKIIPVFYQVKPSDLRYIETGAYAEAFFNYKQKGRYLDKLNAWKEALWSLSLIAGEEFNSEWDCQKIVEAVQKEVKRKTCLYVAEYPVGLNKLVEDFEKRCLDELVQDFENQCGQVEGKHQAKVVGIFGIGGSGKTTLAKELFNRKRSNYTTASFLFDVREASVRSELPSLQSTLLKDLFGKKVNFRTKEDGRSSLKDHLTRGPLLNSLIVVDDIDHVDQLNALLIMDILNESDNSLIIVTTRDAGVLITAGITVGYNLKGMDRNYGRELFCWHAFRQAYPCSGYEVLVDSFVDECRGLPLSIQVLGRHVHGRDHRFWESELIKAKKMLPQDVKQRLKISFDALDGEEKQVFMDISCFFVGKQTSIAERILEGSGWNAHNAMERLKDKCLLEKGKTDDKGLILRMHDHLRDLGREMAVELSPPHRLWRPEDLKSLESIGFKTILTKTSIRCFHSLFDKSMSYNFFLGQPDTFFETSASLLWLQLEVNSTEQPSIPTWIPLQNLRYLEINCRGLKTLWDNHTQAPFQLKELQIYHRSRAFLDYPDAVRSSLKELRLERLNFLEKIYIRNCEYLTSVSGLSNLASLVELEISNCRWLVFENLTLSGMKYLERITFGREVKLKYFRLDDCSKLKTIGLGYDELVELSIRDCPKLVEIPAIIGSSCLEKIIIDGCGKLKHFQLRRCKRLKNVSVNIDLRELFVGECPELEGFPSFARMNNLERIEIYSCEKLRNMMLPTTLISLSVRSCRDLQRVAGIGGLPKLIKLIIKECPELEELPSLAKLSCLGEIVIDSCVKLQNISGIEELHVSEYMGLRYCSSALIRNCIHKLKNVPRRMDMIGRAVDGAESRLNKDLFCDAKIDVDGVIEIGTHETYPEWSGLHTHAVIICFLVVINSSTLVEDINRSLSDSILNVSEGEWIITLVAWADWSLNYLLEIEYVLRMYGVIKKGFQVEVKKGEEWKSVGVLRTVVDQLYHL